MKFARYADRSGEIGFGVVDHDLIYAIPGVFDLTTLLETGEEAFTEAAALGRKTGNAVHPDEVQLLCPMERPSTFRDFYAFEQHVRTTQSWHGQEMNPIWYRLPIFYFSNPYAFTGEGPVRIAPGSSNFDFELEVCAVVGREGQNLTPEEGDQAIAGYCILNDWSARDLQHEEMQLSLGPAKGKDSATGMGPYFVTKDELADFREGAGYRLQMTAHVNGRPYSAATWSEVFWTFGEMASYASRGTQVRPGDVLGSGTCGTGCILELSHSHGTENYPWLVPGDEVVLAIEGLGQLRNTVAPASPLIPLRPQ